MFLVHVLPISRGIAIEHLTYFSREEPRKGAFVHVTLRGTVVSAVVVRTESVADAKSRVRTAGHSLVKLHDAKSASVVHTPYLAATSSFARDTANTIGAVIETLIPKAVLANPHLAEPSHLTDVQKTRVDTHEFLCVQAPYEDRVTMYRTLARECIAKKESLLLVLPTIRESERMFNNIRRGIESHVVLLNSELKVKELLASWKAVGDAEDSRIVLVVGSCLGVPLQNISTIVVEREGADAYARDYRPFTDIRSVAALYAKGLGVRYIIGDSVLRSSVRLSIDEGTAIEYAPGTMTVRTRAKTQLVDMRPYKKDAAGNYRALSSELIAMLNDTDRANNKTFILAGRRGLASSVVCSDCGTSVACKTCTSPYTLSYQGEIRVRTFLCTTCGIQERTDVRCSHCDSWRLVALGAGSQRIEQQLREQFPNRALFRIDKDSAKTPKAVQKIIDKYLESSSGVLVATELALPYLPESIPYVAVASLDSLLAVPELTVDERVFALLMRLREMTEISLIVQSRTPERTILAEALAGDVEGFALSELVRRKELGFPPYSVLITVTRSGKPVTVDRTMQALFSSLLPYQPVILPPLRTRVYTSRLLLKIKRTEWPHKDLLLKLRSLDPGFTVHVGTEALFA